MTSPSDSSISSKKLFQQTLFKGIDLSDRYKGMGTATEQAFQLPLTGAPNS